MWNQRMITVLFLFATDTHHLSEEFLCAHITVCDWAKSGKSLLCTIQTIFAIRPLKLYSPAQTNLKYLTNTWTTLLIQTSFKYLSCTWTKFLTPMCTYNFVAMLDGWLVCWLDWQWFSVTDRQLKRDRKADRQKNRWTNRLASRQRERDCGVGKKEKERERNRGRERQKQRERERERDTHTHTHTPIHKKKREEERRIKPRHRQWKNGIQKETVTKTKRESTTI